MRTSSSAAILLTFALAACGGRTGPPSGPATSASPARAIVDMLQSSAESWNRGDLDGFVDDYLDSPETGFVTSKGIVRGRDGVRQTYLQSYWKDGQAPKDALRFGDIEITPLGKDHALAVGRYILFDRTTQETRATGIFSLVLRRTPDGWKIVHDHSS